PEVVTPQLCPRPTLKPVKVSPPATSTGTLLLVVEPLPSSPASPSPQQYAVPEIVRPQVNPPPVFTSAKMSPPATLTGALPPDSLVAPRPCPPTRPSCPSPQRRGCPRSRRPRRRSHSGRRTPRCGCHRVRLPMHRACTPCLGCR